MSKTEQEREVLFGVVSASLGFASHESVEASALTLSRAPEDAPVAPLAETLASEPGAAFTPERIGLAYSIVDQTLDAAGGDFDKALGLLGAERTRDSLRVSASGEATAGTPVDLASVQAEAVTDEHTGRYDIQEAELGRGGIGRVVIAHDTHLGRDVAMKELLDGVGGSLSTPRLSPPTVRFLREARVTGQLEHPNIVPVYELGQREDGSLYYTMKIVRGRTLSEALSETRSPKERATLLPHFAQACQAIAYAHDRGVIHRDLKPDNIMIGEFGETMVLDWGLAKTRDSVDLREADLARDAERLRGLSASQTVDGQLLGTPLYMSPEQAMGEVGHIGAGSDVWSLGAILYEILTGEQAFHGESLLAIVDRVTEADYVPVRERRPSTSPELAAVCEKALSRRVEDRFPTAAELADEVEAWLTGSRVSSYTYSPLDIARRWIGRHRAAFVVGLAAVVLLAGLGVSSILHIREERDRAMLAETEARAAERAATLERDRAEFLVHFMLGNLKDELVPIGKLDLLDTVTRAILRYYEELGLERDEARYQKARALNIAGEVAVARGAYEEARDALDASAALTRALIQQEDSSPLWRVEAARTRLLRARGLFQRERLAEAEPLVEDAVSVLTAVHTRYPDERDAALLLAEAHTRRGILAQTRAELDVAHAEISHALEIHRTLAEADPDDLDIAHLTAASDERLADVDFELGRLADAEEALGDALILRDKLHLREPNHAGYAFAKARLLDRFGQLYEQRGDMLPALKAFEESYTLLDRLVARDPSNVPWREARARALLAIGSLRVHYDRASRAENALRRARDAFRGLLSIDPDNLRWRRDLADTLFLTASLNALGGQHEDARALLRETRAELETLTEARPDNLRWRRDLALTLTALGRAHLALAELTLARDAFKQTEAILDTLRRALPGSLDAARDLAILHAASSELALEQGRPQDAVGRLEDAIQLYDGLLEQAPENHLWKQERALLQRRAQAASSERAQNPIPAASAQKQDSGKLREEFLLVQQPQRSNSRVRSRPLEQLRSDSVKGHKRRTFMKAIEDLDVDPIEAPTPW